MGHYHSKNQSRSHYDNQSHYDQASYEEGMAQSRPVYGSKNPNSPYTLDNIPRTITQNYDPAVSEVYNKRSKDNSIDKTVEIPPLAQLTEEMIHKRKIRDANQALLFVEDIHYIMHELQDTLVIHDGSRLGFHLHSISEQFSLSRSKSMGRMAYSERTEEFSDKFKFLQENYDRVNRRIKIEDIAKNPKFKGDPARLRLEYLNLSEIRKSQPQKSSGYVKNPLAQGHVYVENYAPVEESGNKFGYQQQQDQMGFSLSKPGLSAPVMMESRFRSQNISDKESKPISRDSSSPSNQNTSRAGNYFEKAKPLPSQSQKSEVSQKISKTVSAQSPMNASKNLNIAKVNSSQTPRNEGRSQVSPRAQTKPTQPHTSRQKSPSPNTIKVDLTGHREGNRSQSPYRQGQNPRIEYKSFWKEAVRPKVKTPKKDERVPFRHESEKVNTSIEQLARTLQSSKKSLTPERGLRQQQTSFHQHQQYQQYQQAAQPKSPMTRDPHREAADFKKSYATASVAESKTTPMRESKQYEKESKYRQKEADPESSNSQNNARQEADLSLGSFGEGKNNSGIEVYGSDAEEPIEGSIDLSSYLLNNQKGTNVASVASQKQAMEPRRFEPERPMLKQQTVERGDPRRGDYGGYNRENEMMKGHQYQQQQQQQQQPRNMGQGQGQMSMKQQLNYNPRGAENEDEFDDQEFINEIREKMQGLSEKMESSFSERHFGKDQSRDEESKHEHLQQQRNGGNPLSKFKTQYDTRPAYEDNLRPDTYSRGQTNQRQEDPSMDWAAGLKVASKKLTSRTDT